MTTRIPGSMLAGGAASMVVGCDCKNNAGAPDTQFDLDADCVVLRDSNHSSVVRFNPGAAITNNISTAGPAANGRDQSGAFSNSSWAHFYWIWNGTTLASVSSATAPPTGPTLPSGYTNWAYAGAVYIDGSGNLIKTLIRGSLASRTFVSLDETNFTDANERSVDASAVIPPNAIAINLSFAIGFGAANESYKIRAITGIDCGFEIESINTDYGSGSVLLPVSGQTIYHLHSAGASTRAVRLHAFGYKVPNGGE